MAITAWYMDGNEGDQREEHKTEETVTEAQLHALGLLTWSGITGEDDANLAKIKSDRGYTYSDVCTIHPDKLPNYEVKIKSFYEEHIHYDEEIRLCLEGSGFFDIRDANNRWIRVHLHAGDMIILPEGIYHRFTTDKDNFIKAMRFFVGEPVWTPYNRADIDEATNESRRKYIAQFLSGSAN